MKGGRTAHSAFKSLATCGADDIYDLSVAYIHAKMLQKFSLIIWNEIVLRYGRRRKALHRTLRNIMQNTHLLRKKVTLLSGDLREVLPVVPPAPELRLSLHVWIHFSYIATFRLCNYRKRNVTEP